MLVRLKRAALRILYELGVLGAYHRLRNRRALTIISLHRVLPPGDPAWRTCDPLYTVSSPLLEQCLRFFAAHYSIISLPELLRARTSGSALPSRPLLITFDDGWADSHRHALPVLRRLGVPAALFVVAGAVGRHEAFFQEQIIAAWRAGALTRERLRALWQLLAPERDAPPDPDTEPAVRALIARLQSVSLARRAPLLATVQGALTTGERQMLTADELRELNASGVAIGTHGTTHEPLTTVPDLGQELEGSREIIAGLLDVPQDGVSTLSFPFSRQNRTVVERARQAGYRLLFGGGLTLAPLAAGVPDLLPRVGITAGEIADSTGALRPEALAAYLFRRPHRGLEPA